MPEADTTRDWYDITCVRNIASGQYIWLPSLVTTVLTTTSSRFNMTFHLLLILFLNYAPGHLAGGWGVEEAFPKLTFNYPVDITYVPDGSRQLMVLEQPGVVRIFSNQYDTDTARIVLDIRSRVSYGGEAGLLGLALHPEFRQNGFIFLNYTRKNGDSLETVVARYQVDLADYTADPASEIVVIRFYQPYDNHNGGSLQFGKDGFLYIGVGDGGSWADPFDNGQNKKSLLGKILRIDVDGKSKGNYGIPADNPFAGDPDGAAEEIFAYGLRNPWRMSFDTETGALWVGDVGQNKREEIDVVVKGGNYGWRLKESIDCYKPDRNCEIPGLIDPILDLPQDKGEHSVTGGFVYRGKKWPGLYGKYIFGDYVSRRIFALTFKNDKAVKNDILTENVGSISSFGVDENQEILICDHASGKILMLKKN